MQFAEAFFDDFQISCDYIPDTCTGTMFSYPVIEIYKNGKRIDGMIGIRTQTQLQNLIVKNGGSTTAVSTPATPTPNKVNIACEGQSATLSCPASQKIQITSALWGRTNSSICCSAGSKCTPTNCLTDPSSTIRFGWCYSTSSCTIPVNTVSFGDPATCFGASKYLSYVYTCV